MTEKKPRFSFVKPAVAALFIGALLTVLAVEVLRLRSEIAPAAASSASPPLPITPPDLDASAHRPATYSNIYRYDYVGPETCGRCHTKNYDSWRAHPHSKMNAN